MKKILVFVLLLCLLLSGCSANSASGGSQVGEYKALRCDAQNFLVLYSRYFTAVSAEDGATIYTADEDELNCIDYYI